MVPMVSVLSSNVAAIGHDAQRAVLFVRFHDGARLYRYDGVQLDVYRAFLAAPSKGHFLARHVKGNYPHRRVA